jgi:hypothetical protein
MAPAAATASMSTCAVKPPGEAYKLLADKGADTVKYSSFLVFAQSFYGGCYIGFGALLATKISSMMPGFADENPGFKTFVFAALFPVNLLLILLTGGVLFTGTAAACPAAVYERKIRIVDAARCLAISWWGNVLGSLLFAVFTMGCELLEGPTARDAILITQKKNFEKLRHHIPQRHRVQLDGVHGGVSVRASPGHDGQISRHMVSDLHFRDDWIRTHSCQFLYHGVGPHRRRCQDGL